MNYGASWCQEQQDTRYTCWQVVQRPELISATGELKDDEGLVQGHSKKVFVITDCILSLQYTRVHWFFHCTTYTIDWSFSMSSLQEGPIGCTVKVRFVEQTVVHHEPAFELWSSAIAPVMHMLQMEGKHNPCLLEDGMVTNRQNSGCDQWNRWPQHRNCPSCL